MCVFSCFNSKHRLNNKSTNKMFFQLHRRNEDDVTCTATSFGGKQTSTFGSSLGWFLFFNQAVEKHQESLVTMRLKKGLKVLYRSVSLRSGPIQAGL